MDVEEIINDAKYGELKQLGVAKELKSSNTTTVEAAEREILTHINLGLLELYKRFDLRVEETVIALHPVQTMYIIDIANIYHVDTNPDGYLDALSDRFDHVIAAYDEEGSKYVLNDENNALSILTPAWNAIQIPNPVVDTAVYIIYAAAPDRLVWNADLSTVKIGLPPAMTEALLHYIGYRGHGSVDGSLNAENNSHYMRFEASCTKLEELGLFALDGIQTGDVQDKGFV